VILGLSVADWLTERMFSWRCMKDIGMIAATAVRLETAAEA